MLEYPLRTLRGWQILKPQ